MEEFSNFCLTNTAAIWLVSKSFKEAFAKIEGQVPVKEFTKNANMNQLKTAMRESMIAQGLEVWSVMLNWMSYNKEYNEIINGPKPLL